MLARRILLAGAAVIFAVGGLMHALAFLERARGLIDAARGTAFFRAELKVLWLADSTTLLSLAIICACIALAPERIPGVLILLVGLISSATAALLYLYLGGFFAAHMLAAASAMMLAAGVLAFRHEARSRGTSPAA